MYSSELRGKEAISLVVRAQRERAARDGAAHRDTDANDFTDLIDAPNVLRQFTHTYTYTPRIAGSEAIILIIDISSLKRTLCLLGLTVMSHRYKLDWNTYYI